MKWTRSLNRSSLTRWRQRTGEAKLLALLQESLATAVRTGAMRPKDLGRVVVDTTVQPKAVMFPTDAKLLNRARERLVRLAEILADWIYKRANEASAGSVTVECGRLRQGVGPGREHG